MSRHDTARWLPILILGAALPATSQPSSAPVPSQAPAPNSMLSITVPPSSNSAPAGQPDTTVRPDPTIQASPDQTNRDQTNPGQTNPGQTNPGQTTPGAQPASANPAAQGTTQAKPPTPEQLGDSLEARGRYQAALQAYARMQGRSAALWNKMGIAYQMLLDQKDASHCYRESLRLEPHNAMVMNNMGTLLDSQKEFHSAEKMYRKALKADPDSAMILKNLGTNLLMQHKYDKGWQAYKQAMAIDPQIFDDRNSPRVQNPTTIQDRGAMNYYMARGCLHIGQTECALQYLRMAVNEGFTTPKKLASDEDFAALRNNPAFKQMLDELNQEKKQQQRQ